MGGYKPLISHTLPKMPWIRGIVPSQAEPVISVGTNPVGPTHSPDTVKKVSIRLSPSYGLTNHSITGARQIAQMSSSSGNEDDAA